MQRPRKTVLMAASLTIFAFAGAVLLYFSFWRSGVAHASPTAELLSEVPAGAPTLVYIDLAAIRASSFYQHRPDKGPITMPDRDYADFVQATGFNFEKDLDRVIIASWPQSTGQDKPKTVAIAEGRFDRRKIHDYAMKKGKLDRQHGHDVFLFPVSGGPGWNSLTFINNHQLALAEGSNVFTALAPPGGDSAADPARERAARLDGAAMFAITRVPEIPDNIAAGEGQSAQLASLARSVQWVTLAAQPEGDVLRVSLEGECKTDTDARQLQSALEILRMFGRAVLESPKSRQTMDPNTLRIAETMLNTAEVSASDDRVRIRLEIGPDILKWNAPHGEPAIAGSR